jgi:hypothetical protein
VFKNSTAGTASSAAIMATYQAKLGAKTTPTGQRDNEYYRLLTHRGFGPDAAGQPAQ